MPRDSGGNYTLPAGNPVASGTVISTTWANPTMDDIAVALTESLSRNGDGGMLVPFLNTDGTLIAPGVSWTNEPSTGFYRAGNNDMRAGVAAADTTRWINASAQPVGEQSPFQIWDGQAWKDALYVGDVSALPILPNDTFLQGRNAANDGDINIVKVNASDQIEFGAVASQFNADVNVGTYVSTGLTTGILAGIAGAGFAQSNAQIAGVFFFQTLVYGSGDTYRFGLNEDDMTIYTNDNVAAMRFDNAQNIEIPNGNLKVLGNSANILVQSVATSAFLDMHTTNAPADTSYFRTQTSDNGFWTVQARSDAAGFLRNLLTLAHDGSGLIVDAGDLTLTNGAILGFGNQGNVVLTETSFLARSHATNGLTLSGFGTSYDVSLANKAGTIGLRIPTGTTDIQIPAGDLQISTGKLIVGNSGVLSSIELASEGQNSVKFLNDSFTTHWTIYSNTGAVGAQGTFNIFNNITGMNTLSINTLDDATFVGTVTVDDLTADRVFVDGIVALDRNGTELRLGVTNDGNTTIYSNGTQLGLVVESIGTRVATGNLVVQAGSLSVTNDNSADHQLLMENTNATSGADVLIKAKVADGGGNAFASWERSGVFAWTAGLVQANNRFVISASGAFNTNNAIEIDSSQNVTVPNGGLKVSAGFMSYGDSSLVTISGDAITATRTQHSVAGEGGVADDLATINGGAAGDVLILKGQSNGITITIKHGTGNIFMGTGADVVMTATSDTCTLIYTGTSWIVTSSFT